MTFGRGLKFSRPFSESCLISKDSMVQFLMLSKWRIWLPRSFGVCVRWHNTHHGWFNLEGFTKKMRAVFETHKQRSVGCWMPIIERCLNCMKKTLVFWWVTSCYCCYFLTYALQVFLKTHVSICRRLAMLLPISSIHDIFTYMWFVFMMFI